MTPEEKIAKFLHNLALALESQKLRPFKEGVLIAAVPVVVKHYLEGV